MNINNVHPSSAVRLTGFTILDSEKTDLFILTTERMFSVDHHGVAVGVEAIAFTEGGFVGGPQ